jgi:hypothetical protein
MNTLITNANTLWTDAISGAGTLLTWPIGYIVVFVIAVSLVGLVVGWIKTMTR